MSRSNGNGHKPDALARVKKLTSSAVKPFEPTSRDWDILSAWLTLREERKRASWRNLAHLAGCSHTLIGDRFKDGGFAAWWKAAMFELAHSRYWPEAKVATAIRAADDLEAFKTLIPIMEPQAAQPGVNPAPQQNAFVVNVHGLVGSHE